MCLGGLEGSNRDETPVLGLMRRGQAKSAPNLYGDVNRARSHNDARLWATSQRLG